MKTTRLAMLLVLLFCSTSRAKSLQDANLLDDMRSLLKEYHFQPSDNHWEPDGDERLAQCKVFTGAAILVADEPTPAPRSYAELAIQICGGFRRLYDLGEWDSKSDRVVAADPNNLQAGEATLGWTNESKASKGDESITLRVQVVALSNAKIGIFLTLVHVTPRTTPGT